MPVVQISCSGHNPQKALVSIDRYPSLASFLQTLPARFNVKPHPRASLTYVENGQPYDITDDEGWLIALGEMETQPKPTLVWTLPVSGTKREREVQDTDREGMDVLSQLLAAPAAATAAAAASPSGNPEVPVPPKRRRRSSKNPNIDGSPAAPAHVKRQQQQTELYRRLSKEQGHAAAFDALDKAWQERFYALADIVQDIFGSRHYLLNPLEVACPLCLASIKLSQICERRMGNLMHAQHHLRKVHYDSPIPVVQNTAQALVQRWEERFGNAKMCVTPLTEEMKRCLRDINGGRDVPLQPQQHVTSQEAGHPQLVGPPQVVGMSLAHPPDTHPAANLAHQAGAQGVLSMAPQGMQHVAHVMMSSR
ncbi:hypothetical protein SpCBS45565_g00828 [Spizellomyces sp. 'palustris']|nr:hypothetical protein SpCBS45565_g00828 [Spizellomyces sp. 'palustris']